MRIGDFEFDPDTGDLRRTNPAPGGAAVRLPPQPAKLLALLVSRRGDLVDRDEIRRALWPDTHVDVDQSLAFCVRQLRAALGDSGSSPAYIETLPRRGFRLIAPMNDAPVQRGAQPVSKTGVGWVVALLLAVAAASAFVFLSRRSVNDGIRLAIMPFELAASAERSEERSRLALVSETLLVDLARDDGAGLEVIGPRTTAKYHGSPFPDLDALVNELGIDYVLNGRYLEPPPDSAPAESAPVLLVELIRLEDRAHPWVERFDGDGSPRDIAAAVEAGVRQTLDRSR